MRTLLAGLTALVLATPATAGSAIARYDIYVGGLKAFELEAGLSLTEVGYTMQITGRTHGMAEWLLGFRSRVHAEGEASPSGIRPQRYRNDALFRGKPRAITLDFPPGQPMVVSVTPPPEEDDRDPVTPAQRATAVDPLTAMVTALRHVASRGLCQQDIAVFDGRRRFDAVFQPGSVTTLGATRLGIFQGDATHCILTMRQIAGYTRRAHEFNRAEDREQPIDIWLAPVAAGLPAIPVRVEVVLTLGSIVAHLTKIETVPALPPLPTAPLTR